MKNQDAFPTLENEFIDDEEEEVSEHDTAQQEEDVKQANE
jgi:hypothetical protein